MPKPTPGKQYVIQDENTLSQVARRAYGNSNHWPRIWRANQSQLRSGNPNLIYTGEIVFIPEIAELLRATPDISNREPDELSIIIDGIEILSTASKVTLTMDTASNGWTATLPWIPGENIELDKRLLPFASPPVKVFIGGVLVESGKLYDSDSELTLDGSIKKLAGYSKTADLIDSNMKPPYEEDNVTLKQRIDKIVQAHGIKAVFDADPGGPFDRVTAGETEKIGEHLKKLVFQRALVMSDTPEGNLLITEADTKSPPVATLEEGQPSVGLFSAAFKGRKRYNTVRVVSSTPFGEEEAIAKDDSIAGSRTKTIRVQDITGGELQAVAEWELNKIIIDSLTIPIPVSGWLDPSGKLWRPNTKVTLISPTLHVPNGFDFLIRSINLDEDKNKKDAILNLIPPQAYTKEKVIVPWA